ncbi:hypothetical protein ONZ45_g10795 [Pleurotus djamor]|nr:hypothetical protein ONZ45_g10795 [Pleurotus djamor]
MSVDVLTLIGTEAKTTIQSTVADHDLTAEQWEQAHPHLAFLELSDKELSALVPVAQLATAESGDDSTPFVKYCSIATFNQFELGLFVAGRINWVKKYFNLQAFVILKSPAKFRSVKGPSFSGSTETNEHVGPVSVALPYVDNLNIWAKADGTGEFYVTVNAWFFTRSYQKRFLVATLE